METVEFLVKEFSDKRLMLLIVFKEGKNFRIHRRNGETYYTWCPHEYTLKFAKRLYETLDNDNKKSLKRRGLKKDSGSKPFYT